MKYDAIIIGAGPSGVTCAARIAQLGGKVAIVEKSFFGGVCSNWGCIPTKAMVASAKIVHENSLSEKLGIVTTTKVNFDKVVKHRDEQINLSRKSMKLVLKSFGVDIIIGEGKIIDKDTVQVKDKKYSTKNMVICTGSKPVFPPFIKLNDNILSSKQFVKINKLPKKIVIIGGGVIGVEFASIFALLGSKVTIVEMFDRLLVNEDNEISNILETEFMKLGINLDLGQGVKSIDENFVYTKTAKYEYDKVLVATGRAPIIDEEMLKNVNVKYSKKGIDVNDKMETSIDNIYSIGDSTGKSILAHVGTRQAIVAAHNIMKQKDNMDYIVPRCVYSIPEIACVGKTQNECKNPKTALFDLKWNAKAQLSGHEVGFIKVISENNMIVGFQMIGHNVSELVGEAIVIIQKKISAKDIAKIIHPHQTVGESVKLSVLKLMDELVDIPKDK